MNFKYYIELCLIGLVSTESLASMIQLLIASKSEMTNFTNQILLEWTLEDLKNEDEDFFAELFEGVFIKLLWIVSYLLSCLGCMGMAFLTWFERSGQAGHFRTLKNQLISANLDTVRRRIKCFCLDENKISCSRPLFMYWLCRQLIH